MGGKCCYNKKLIIFFLGREDEDKRTVKIKFYLFILKTVLVGHILK